MKHALTLLTTLLFAPLATVAVAQHQTTGPDHLPASDRRNVLFVAVDDLRTELGCYGVEAIQSPHIDRLASRGTVFDLAYCQQAVCSPSRTSLLTGCRPDTTKVYDLETHFRKHLPDVVTLPQHFKNQGYFTRSVGKIFHGGLDDATSWSEPPAKAGRPGYLLPENQALVARKTEAAKGKEFATASARYNSMTGPAWECADVPDNSYHDGAVADAAIEMLRQAKDKPFFLAVGFHKPHLPFVAPKKYWDLYRSGEIPWRPTRSRQPTRQSLPWLIGANCGLTMTSLVSVR